MSNYNAKLDLFAILNCTKTATYEELKRNYQKLARKCHPDKHTGANEDFISIDKAWKTLRDDALRKDYEKRHEQDDIESNEFIYAELTKKELTFDENGCSLYPCRCGSGFEIYKDDLVDEEILIECVECTNCIVIK